MTLCNKCGSEIDEWREINGRKVPFHQCAFSGLNDFLSFNKLEDYCNPNAKCPSCLKDVFYYQNVHGSKVYFEYAGWPWEKHDCIGNRMPPIPIRSKGMKNSLIGADGERFDCFKNGGVRSINDWDQDAVSIHLLRLLNKKGHTRYVICLNDPERVYWDALSEAPAFLVDQETNIGEAHALHFIDYQSLAFSKVMVKPSNLPLDEAQSYFRGRMSEP